MANRKNKSTDANDLDLGYAQRSALPLQSFYFLLPLIVAYEAAMILFYRNGLQTDIIARRMLRITGEFLGIGEIMLYLPGPLIAGALLGMHFASKQRFTSKAWRFDLGLHLRMWVETLAWAIPLLLFGTLFLQATAGDTTLQASDNASLLGERLVLSVGAGLYEELLFRLIGIAIVHAILVDVLALPKHVGQIGAIAGTAILFSAYHFLQVGREFDLRFFVFATAAGVYFAWLYVARGFGIAAGTHAVYDIVATLLAAILSSSGP
jgi:hypothetical protein